jgi:hypothetical protein
MGYRWRAKLSAAEKTRRKSEYQRRMREGKKQAAEYRASTEEAKSDK